MRIVLVLTFLFSVKFAAAAEYGVFMIVEGDVQIENAQSALLPAKVNSKIQSGETVITSAEGRAKIVMTDRNVIVIMPNSRMKIEKYSETPEDKSVTLSLIEGTIRTDVEQTYDDENSKFEVRTPTATVGVRGTQFITSYNKTDDTTEVTALRGRVRFQAGSAAKFIIINKGERFRARAGKIGTGSPRKLSITEIKRIDRDSLRSLKGRVLNRKRLKR